MNKLKTFLSLFFCGLAIELIEEILEEFIAWGISNFITFVITKAFSVVIVFLGTQTTKFFIKKIIKKITYKEGNDKVKLLQKYWKIVWGNKVTGTLAGIGFAGITYFQDLIMLPVSIGLKVLVVFVAFVIGYNIGIFFGGETLNQIIARGEEALLDKEEKKKMKAIKNKVKELANQQQEELYAKATEMVKAEADAKIEEAKTDIPKA